jgi:hypothetical protein
LLQMSLLPLKSHGNSHPAVAAAGIMSTAATAAPRIHRRFRGVCTTVSRS